MRCCVFVWVKRQKPISLIPITADGPVAEPTIRGDRKKVPFHCFYPYCISIRRIGNSTISSQLCVRNICPIFFVCFVDQKRLMLKKFFGQKAEAIRPSDSN